MEGFSSAHRLLLLPGLAWRPRCSFRCSPCPDPRLAKGLNERGQLVSAARDRLGIVPAESLTAAEALDLFTTGAARAVNDDARLAPGAGATFTVLDTDPLTASPDQLRAARVLDVWIDGAPVQVPAGINAWQV